MTTLIEWFNINYGSVIIGTIFLVIAGYNSYKKYKQKKGKLEEQPYIDTSLLELELFEDNGAGNSLSSFKKQKIVTEKSITQVKKEAKRVVGEEQKLDYEYRQKKMQFANQRKRLGLNYSNYMHQSRIIDEMIQNQMKMQEEFDKTKHGN